MASTQPEVTQTPAPVPTVEPVSAVEAPEPPPQHLCVMFSEEEPATAPHAEAMPMAQRKIWTCAAKQVIARVLPADQAPESTTRPRSIPMPDAKLGRNVEWNATGNAVIAQKAGHILLRSNTLSVEDALELSEDLDASDGPVSFPGPVVVRRNVLDLVTLSASGDITVNGSIEAATIETGGNLTVHHGICGKEHGRVSAVGNITARFVSNAQVNGADVHIANEVSNSRIVCRGRFMSENATVLSGHITAGGGIVCESAGSEAGIRVILELSLTPEELKRISVLSNELSIARQKSEQIHSAIEPLMRNPKLLNAKQKEKATELLYTAQEADARASEIVASMAQPRQQLEALSQSTIQVRSRLYAGVTVRIGGIESTIQTELRGPLKIVRRGEQHTPQLLAIDSAQRVLATLPINTTEEHTLLHHIQTGTV